MTPQNSLPHRLERLTAAIETLNARIDAFDKATRRLRRKRSYQVYREYLEAHQ